MRATRSELGNSPPRSVGPPAKPITDARPSIGDGRGNRRSRGRIATASVDAAMVSATSRAVIFMFGCSPHNEVRARYKAHCDENKLLGIVFAGVLRFSPDGNSSTVRAYY
jgi:hypothetical protein